MLAGGSLLAEAGNASAKRDDKQLFGDGCFSLRLCILKNCHDIFASQDAILGTGPDIRELKVIGGAELCLAVGVIGEEGAQPFVGLRIVLRQ